MFAVGDKFQSVYGFRGADFQAMDNVRSTFKCESLPLSVTYRCAKNIVKLAQSFVSTIQPADTAPDGKVETLNSYTINTLEKPTQYCVVILLP